MSASQKRIATATYNPPGWPIVERDLLIAFLQHVLVVRLGPNVAQSGKPEHLAQIAAALDRAPDGFRYAVLVDAEHSIQVDARRRRELADFVQSRAVRHGTACLAEVLVTRSPVMLGVAQVIGWLAPRAIPARSAPTVEAGLNIIGEYSPGLDVAMCLKNYGQLLRLQQQTSAASG